MLRPSPGTTLFRVYRITLTIAVGAAFFAAAIWVLNVPANRALLVSFVFVCSAFIALYIYQNNQIRSGLERRLQDLSLLNQIGQVIRYATDLESLLEAIHAQLTDLLGIDSFYVALYEPATDSLWYPLAVKGGVSQEWPRRPLANRLTDRVITEKQPILLSREADRELERIGAPLGEDPLYSWLGVPLITPERTLGCLAVLSLSPQVSFTDDDLNLLNTLSGQVSIALQNALLHEQTGRKISRQAEQLKILDLIGRQLSAALESDDLFKLILDYALEFTRSPWGSIAVYNPVAEIFEMRAHRGYHLSSNDLPAGVGIAGRVVRTGQAEVVKEVSADPDFHDLTGGQTTSQLTVPIIYKERVMGILSLESPRTNAYHQVELNFATQLAQQAALAIHNASLYDEAQRRLREQATLFLVSARLVANQELDEVLTTVAQAFSAALESFLVGVYLWEPSEERYHCRAEMERDYNLNVHLPPTFSAKEWQSILHHQKAAGPLLITKDQPKLARIVRLAKDCQALIFPLKIAGQDLGFVICHLNNTRPYHESELQLLRAIAAQSSIAIQNALLFSDVSSGHNRLAAVLDSVGEGILMVDALGRVILANSPIAAFTRTNIDRVIGEKLADLPIGVLNALGIERAQARALSLTIENHQDDQLPPSRTFHHKERFYERWIAPVWSAAGQVILGWVIVVRDITEQRQVDQARELLTETLVHDLRSPISAVKTTLDLLEENIPPGERDQLTEQSLNIARRSTERVLNLIGSLLHISWLESGQIDLQAENLSIQDLASETITEAIPQASQDGIVLRTELPDSLSPIQVDPNLIRRVLSNLLDNALKFTPEGGVVTVQAEPGQNGFILVRVCDTGPGIPENYREEVFSRFNQVPDQQARRRGTGLGLTFCRLAVEAHGGEIWVEPHSPGSGATLAFTLPTSENNDK